MKDGRWRNAKACCPFYKYESKQAIYCKGVQPDAAITQTFPVADKKEYLHTFCQADYRACWIAEAHLRACGSWEEPPETDLPDLVLLQELQETEAPTFKTL